MMSIKKASQQAVSCEDALLVGVNDRSILLYNMNTEDILHIYDIQKDEFKQIQWIKGILECRHIKYCKKNRQDLSRVFNFSFSSNSEIFYVRVD